MTDEELLKKRFTELSEKSYSSGIFLFTDFLSISELALFYETKPRERGIRFTAFGGAEGTERVMLRFGDKDELMYEEPFPIKCLKAEPLMQKFADKLTHRDLLGALMSLGIERSVIGDIALIDNVGYIFVKEDMAEYIISSLKVAKHTPLKLSVAESIPEGELYKTERRVLKAVGERVDAIIAKLFSLSRDEATALFTKGLVFIEGVKCENRSRSLRDGDRVSVRGYGRFIYRAYSSTTKKGKLNIEVDLYV